MNEAALHELLSGRRRGVVAAILRCLLQTASWGYYAVMRLRNGCYDRGWLATQRAPVPVISLGNITTGGTGKTPLAAWLANWLNDQGKKPGLLSRGYRSLKSASETNPVNSSVEASVGNDEKLVLDRLCPNVPHLQQRDRVASAQNAVREFGCDVLLLDDGFQHRRLARNLDLVLIDALQPWGYDHVLPRGLLREPLSGLHRADLILITRADQCSPERRQTLLAKIREVRGIDECIEVAFVPRRLVDQNWQSHPFSAASGKKAIAFCGIGNPNGFRGTIAAIGLNCEYMQVFPDHHHYGDTDLKQLADNARELSAEVVFTTQKDLVKIPQNAWSGPPLYAIEIGVEFLSGQALLESRLTSLFKSL